MLDFVVYLSAPDKPVPEVMPISFLFLLYRRDVKNKSFAVRCVNIWNSIPAEAVASNNVKTFEAQLEIFLRDRLYENSYYHRKIL